MKKTLIASAIAAAIVSGPVLAQAEANVERAADELAARLDSMVDVYGNIQFALVHQNIDNGNSSFDFVDGNRSTIGFKHDHEVLPGVKAFYKAEFEFNADSKDTSAGLNELDEAYIGLEGDFGQIWAGSDDSVYEVAIDEISNYYERYVQDIPGPYTTGEGDLIQYSSLSYGGLEFHGAVQINGDDLDGTTEKSYPYQLAATYEMGNLEFALGMDSNDGGGTSYLGLPAANNENTYGLRASYDNGGMRLTAQFQTRSDVADVYGLFGAYSIGSTTFAASWERAAFDEAEGTDVDLFTAQALHSLSEHLYIYVEGYFGSGENDIYDTMNTDTSTLGDQDEKQDLAVGATYYF